MTSRHVPAVARTCVCSCLSPDDPISLLTPSLAYNHRQAIPARFKALEQDTDSQAKIIWSMKQLGWQDAELEGVLSSLIPNLTDLLQA